MQNPINFTAASSGFAITPHDTNFFRPTTGLMIGTAGALAVTFIDDSECVFPNVPAGFAPLQVKRIKATGTTAAGIVGLV